MLLEGKDGYKIEYTYIISQAQLHSLMMCYQPCVGSQAISLFLTLIAEACKDQLYYDTHHRLCKLMAMDIQSIEQALKRLEEFHLVRTFVRQEEDRKHVIYMLRPVLLIDDFINHQTLGRIYLQSIGADDIAVTKQKTSRWMADKIGFQETTRSLGTTWLNSWDETDEQKFKLVKPRSIVERQVIEQSGFDIQRFLQESTPLSFPVGARTPEAIRAISELATVYGISHDSLRIAVGRSLTPDSKQVDIAKLSFLVRRQTSQEVKAPDSKYDLAPIVFLKQLQGGSEVFEGEARLLESLVTKQKMPYQVVNVMIEGILKTNDNKLTKGFVESIAATWIRNNINTLEKALEAVKTIGANTYSYNKTRVRKAVLPQGYKQEVTQDKPLTAQQKRQLEESLKKLGGN